MQARVPILVALLVGSVAFALYRATMLPGLDLGDTASFQTRVGTALLTPRDGYPLYTALGTSFHRLTGSTPAHALNLASTIQAAVACAVVVLLGVELGGTVVAAAGAALLFAVSYTFWSQAIIAEVYALHMIFVALTLLLALRWSRDPTTGRLAWLFAVYAVGFGNHLSMILLAPGLTLFLLASAPTGWRSMMAPKIVGLALACALLGAAPYLWNFSTMWRLPEPPGTWSAALERFWFDVTKADWRETMVLEVPPTVVLDHAAMYLFDLRQQFGWVGPIVAAIGAAWLARTSRRDALLLVSVYVVTVTFAFGYNVGDKHVFYLPSHLVLALFMVPGTAALGSLVRRRELVAMLLLLYASARGWRDYPALDRSRDDRPSRLLAGLTAGLDDRRAILLTNFDWQVQNGLSYFGNAVAPQVAYLRIPPAVPYAPALIADNLAIGRRVVATDGAVRALVAAYGPLIAADSDARAETSLQQAVRDLPDGTRYVLCILKPTRSFALRWNDIGATLAALTGSAVPVPHGDYVALAGRRGRPADFVLGSNRPFRRFVDLAGVPVDIRMESWLAADTIRRMGFGHVIAARRHTLIVERGVSFVAFDASGQAVRTAYASNIFEPEPRYLIRLR